MKKLDKETLAQRDEIAGRLRDRFSDLEGAVDTFNQKVADAWSKVSAAITEYNETLDEAWTSEVDGFETVLNDYNDAINDANAWQSDIANEIQEYMDNRSEKWQESEAAGRYTSWKEEFDYELPTCDLERPADLELEEPEELSVGDMDDAAETLEQRQEELGD